MIKTRLWSQFNKTWFKAASGIMLTGTIVSQSPLLQEAKKEEEFKPSQKMTNLVKHIQHQMTSELEKLDSKSFQFDHWERKEGGYGTSAVLQSGSTFEKAGVNISIIKSKAPKPLIQRMSSKDLGFDLSKSYDFFVAGVSMVIHPHNPHVPTMHANYRYFELLQDGEVKASWYGGGCDLTPSYLYEEDATHFHQVIKDVCDKHDKGYYPRFKKWCDEYFFNTHRGESRGVGGIFFDDLNDKPSKQVYNFVEDCGNALVKQYIPIVKKRMDTPYTSAQKEWQQIRRGRYVEFNLIHDRGTKFGLATPGVRIESVLMSLPLTARWEYQHSPVFGSPEERLLNVLKEPKEWAK